MPSKKRSRGPSKAEVASAAGSLPPIDDLSLRDSEAEVSEVYAMLESDAMAELIAEMSDDVIERLACEAEARKAKAMRRECDAVVATPAMMLGFARLQQTAPCPCS